MEKDRKRLYKKALVLFFILMAAGTIISRAADSMTVPEAEVEKAEKGSILYYLSGNGSIAPVEKNTYLIPEGFLVEFCREDGSSIEEGDMLIQFQREHLEQKRQELETELEKAKIQLKQTSLEKTGNVWLESEEAAQRTLDKVQTEYNQKHADRQLAIDESNYALTILSQEMEAAKEQAEQQREELGEEAYISMIEEAEAGFKEKKAELDTRLRETENQLSQAGENLSQAEEGLESARKNDEVLRKNAKKSEEAAGYMVERAKLDMEKAEKSLEKVKELIAGEGKIYAAEKGIFLNTKVTAGMMTTGSEFISIGTGGFEFRAEISKEESIKLTEGDTISIKIPGKETLEAPVTELLLTEKEEEGEIKEVMVLKAELSEELYDSGRYGTFSIKKESEDYQNILPLTAVRQDSKGYYCLGIRTQNSILGEEVKAERIQITLLEKDDNYAAVQGAIHPDTEIITGSNKDILPGDRVRVKR